MTDAASDAASDAVRTALGLFRRSVLKREKYRQLVRHMAPPAGGVNLDIGADNGVISYLLRQGGGEWHSADLDPRAVAAIRELVGERVERLDGGRTPYGDATFDQVVIVDFLEHIADDRGFVAELARIVKPGGRLVVNVPHHQPGSRLARLRDALGLTDAWHGHLRPGYTRAELDALLAPAFAVERGTTYSKLFSELIDTALNWAYERGRGGSGGATSSKGSVVTAADVRKQRKRFLLLSVAYPVLWTVAQLDRLLPFQPGYKLIVQATATRHGPARAGRSTP